MEMARRQTTKIKRRSKTKSESIKTTRPISTRTRVAIHNLRQKDETMVTTHRWMVTIMMMMAARLNA